MYGRKLSAYCTGCCIAATSCMPPKSTCMPPKSEAHALLRNVIRPEGIDSFYSL